MEIQDYDVKTVHASGTKLVVPDALSRDSAMKLPYQQCSRALKDATKDVSVLGKATILGGELTIE